MRKRDRVYRKVGKWKLQFRVKKQKFGDRIGPFYLLISPQNP